jgi:hypothetical protein
MFQELDNLFILAQVDLLIFVEEVTILIAFVLTSTEIVHVLGNVGTVLSADFSNSVFVGLLDGFSSFGVGFLFEQQVVQAACESVHLHVVQEQFVEAGHQLSSGLFTIKLIEAVQESIIAS